MTLYVLHFVDADAVQVDGVFDSWERADGARLALSQALKRPIGRWRILEFMLNDYRT